MLALALTDDDLARIRLADRVAPMLELRALLRAEQHRTPPGRRPAGVRDLVAQPCAPGFLFPTSGDADEAVESVASAARGVVERDLRDNAAAGFPLPNWTADLALPGVAGTAARNELRDDLADAVSGYVEPRTRWAARPVAAVVRRWRHLLASRGPAALLNGLHPGVRYASGVLEVDLASGTRVDAAAHGSGLRIVPTLSRLPGVTVGADGAVPAVLVCPVSPALRPGPDTAANAALADLLGQTRATVLQAIAAEPGSGTRALARRVGIAASSASEHARVLRSAGLTSSGAPGERTAHRPTPLGWALLDGSYT